MLYCISDYEHNKTPLEFIVGFVSINFRSFIFNKPVNIDGLLICLPNWLACYPTSLE